MALDTWTMQGDNNSGTGVGGDLALDMSSGLGNEVFGDLG